MPGRTCADEPPVGGRAKPDARRNFTALPFNIMRIGQKSRLTPHLKAAVGRIDNLPRPALGHQAQGEQTGSALSKGVAQMTLVINIPPRMMRIGAGRNGSWVRSLPYSTDAAEILSAAPAHVGYPRPNTAG